jgi:hypothetical protein
MPAIACSAEIGSWRWCADGVPFSQRWICPSTNAPEFEPREIDLDPSKTLELG